MNLFVTNHKKLLCVNYMCYKSIHVSSPQKQVAKELLEDFTAN